MSCPHCNARTEKDARDFIVCVDCAKALRFDSYEASLEQRIIEARDQRRIESRVSA